MGTWNRHIFFYITIFIFILACKAEKKLDIRSERVFQETIVKGDESELKEYFTLKKSWENGFNSNRYGIALKSYPYPFITGGKLVFNSNKGVVLYSLTDKKTIRFIEGFKYFAHDEEKRGFVSANESKIRLDSFDENKNIWTAKNPIPSFDRLYIYSGYILIRDLSLNIACISIKDGSVLWSISAEEVLTLERTFSRKRLWRTPDDPFFKFFNVSEFAFSKGTFTFGVRRGYLFNYSIANGKENWRINVEYPANGPIKANGDNVFLGSSKGRLFIFSINKGENRIIYKTEGNGDITTLYRDGSRLYCFASPLFIVNLNNLSIERIASVHTGYTYPHSVSIAGDYIWTVPVNPYDSGAFLQGFKLSNFLESRVLFEPEGRGYAPMEVAEGMLEEYKNIERFKKNHLLEWNDHFILVEPDAIVAYKIVPQE